MPRGLFDQVQEHPANGPGLNILQKPRHTSRDRDRVAEIIEVSNEFFRLVRRHGVVGEDLVETVVGREPETVHVLRRVRPRRAPHGVHPAALYLRQMPEAPPTDSPLALGVAAASASVRPYAVTRTSPR